MSYDLCRPPVETEALLRSVDRLTDNERRAFAYWAAMTQTDVYESWCRARGALAEQRSQSERIGS